MYWCNVTFSMQLMSDNAHDEIQAPAYLEDYWE